MSGPLRPPARAAKVEATFLSALDRAPEQREAFIAGECAGDEELSAEVKEMLALHRKAGDFMEEPPMTPEIEEQLARLKPEEAGEIIGNYKLREQIGEGGFGTVWVADQEKPVRRRVALKIVKMGMDTKEVIARFEAERQALAMMDHPNIAKVFDAGATQYGRPFFVMELVKGMAITQYCDEAGLSTRERLALFGDVCSAINHAHQKGIIHRDIKPSNVMITLHGDKAVVKVIDFGIAKATQGKITEHTVYTQFQQMIGTPAYMSPEQAGMSGLDVDTRSDIYALGVLLYELLVGRPPFDGKSLAEAGYEEMRRIIREVEPVKPSSRLCTITEEDRTLLAKARHIEPAKVGRLVEPDLDWIVMKAIDKDRTRRYETANAFALDIAHFLADEPVSATPPSAGYQFRKFARRNKTALRVAGVIAAVLVVATGVSTWQAVRATRAEKKTAETLVQVASERDAKELARSDAEAALHFIQDEVLSQASPGIQPDRELTVRALLDRIAGRLDRATGRPPLVEASIRQTLGSVYTELGDYAKAIEHFEAALRIQRGQLGESHLDTLRSLNGLATAHWWGGEPSLAEPLVRQGLETSRRALGEKHPLTLQFVQTQAFIVMALADKPWSEVEGLFTQTLALHREVLGPDDPGTLRLMMGLSMGSLEHQQAGKVESLLVDALDRSRRVLGEKHPTTVGLITMLAANYRTLRQLDKAEALALRAVELHRSTFGEEHPLTMATDCLLAGIYVAQKNLDKARPLTEKALNLSRRLPLEKCALSAGNLSRLGWDYLEQGDLAQADILCDLAWQAMRRNPAFNPVGSPSIIVQLGGVRLAQQNYPEAETLLREGLRLAEKYDLDADYQLTVMNFLGASLAGQKKYVAAEPLLLQSGRGLQQRQASLPPYLNAARRIPESLERLVQLYDAWDKPAEAAEWKKKLTEFQGKK